MGAVAQATAPLATASPNERAWRGFKPGPWQSRINLRDFIQRNYTPYEGDASFLAGPTARTRKVWEKHLVRRGCGPRCSASLEVLGATRAS
jgi:formate C-acetyltransferase